MRSIGARFVFVVTALALAALVSVVLVSTRATREHAIGILRDELELALAFEVAVREYVNDTVRPRVAPYVGEDDFVPEIQSSSYVARQVFDRVRARFPSYVLRFAAIDPRNPSNAASPEEERIIAAFAADPTLDELTEEVTWDGRRYLAQFHVRRTESACLQCHGEPESAPSGLVASYGPDRGFGRAVGSVAGIETVAVPLSAIDDAIARERRLLFFVVVGTLLLMVLGCLLAFRWLVSRRLARLRARFERAAVEDGEPLVADGAGADDEDDEIGALARAFNVLAAQVEDTRGSLERQVAERTEALERANQDLKNEIEERRGAERALFQSQKLEAVGLLAGGVAHDFNNLLTTIIGCCEFLEDDLEDHPTATEDLADIRTAAEGATTLTRQLLAFSRRQVLQPDVVDLNEVIRSLERMLRRLLGEQIELSTELDAELAPVMADPGQLEQIILNLAVNARDAMPDGGRLFIRTARVGSGADSAARPSDFEGGEYVTLSVVDTGHGMDEETRARVFEPFFTTKELGRGTGLGLSTVYGIVRQSGGTVTVDSKPGAGTRFDVHLPVAEKDARPSARPQDEAGDDFRGTETILVAEDDESVGVLLRRALERRGFDVILTRTPGEALLACELHEGPIHMLLSDVVMPRLTGPELAHRVVAERPDVRVLLVSGYAPQQDASGRFATDDFPFLPKPFTATTLARKVREVLDAPCARPPAGLQDPSPVQPAV